VNNETKEVPCEFAGCTARVSLSRFDESVWLPVFKSTREHLGYFCPRHVEFVRAKQMEARYLLSRAGPDEIIIDRLPLRRPEP